MRVSVRASVCARVCVYVTHTNTRTHTNTMNDFIPTPFPPSASPSLPLFPSCTKATCLTFVPTLICARRKKKHTHKKRDVHYSVVSSRLNFISFSSCWRTISISCDLQMTLCCRAAHLVRRLWERKKKKSVWRIPPGVVKEKHWVFKLGPRLKGKSCLRQEETLM